MSEKTNLWDGVVYTGKYSSGTEIISSSEPVVYYVIPLVVDHIYELECSEPHNRRRIATTSFDPSKSEGSGIRSLIEDTDPTVPYKLAFQAQTDENYLFVYVSNQGETPAISVYDVTVPEGKYYYNGVLLPRLPVLALAEHPYVWIRENKTTGFYDAVFSEKKPWYNASDNAISYGSGSDTVTYYQIPISSAETAIEWTLNSTLNTYFGLDSSRTVLWSNCDIPTGSDTSTDIYFYATDPIKEKEYVGGIQSDITSVTLSSSTGNFELGSEYRFNKTVTALAIRIYAPSGSQVSKGTLWDESGTKLAETNSVTCFGDQWWTLTFIEPVVLEAGKNYIVSASFSSYHSIESANLTFSDAVSFVQSRYTQSVKTFPSTAFNSKVYGLVDVVYQGSALEPDEPSIRTRGYLIQLGDSLFTVTDGVLTAVEGSVNAELFRTYGVDEVPSSDLLVTLTDPVVLYWTEADKIRPLVAVEQAVPFQQVIETPNYSMRHPSIMGIEKVLVEATYDVGFAVSFDSGDTWLVWTGSAWGELSEGDTGMSAEMMKSISSEDWNSVATTGTFKFRAVLPTVNSTITSLVVDYLN